MSVTAEKKQEIISSNARDPKDTGSPEVQVAILSERIANLNLGSPWLVKVFASKKGSGGAYTATFTFATAEPAFEVEPDNRAVDATPLPLGTPTRGLLADRVFGQFGENVHGMRRSRSTTWRKLSSGMNPSCDCVFCSDTLIGPVG